MTAIKKYPGLPPHDHHEEKIREEKFRQKLKKFTKTLQNIYNEEVEKTTDRVYPEYRTVKSSLYRARAKKMPPIPRTFRNLQIRGSWKKTLSGELFLLKNDCENSIVIFTTNENLRMLGECKNVLADGTLKSSPPVRTALCSLWER